jgi:hypothetical protein
MTIPSSGPVTFTDIQTEFGGTNPIALNEYYAGGGLVPAGTTGTYGAVPSSGQISVQNFYGTTAYTPIYVEEVFSSWLYAGNGSTQAIPNGIDLATKGGLVYFGRRLTGDNHWLIDTARGGTKFLTSNTTGAQAGADNYISSFNSNGFTLGTGSGETNSSFSSGGAYVAWTFRKQPKFFDIVTYTGNGVSGRSVSHNLGSTPGCIIIKSTTRTSDWVVYHRSVGSSATLILNSTVASADYGNNISSVTSTSFSVTGGSDSNANGDTYVAYIYAHNAGGFGPTGSDNVITCGSFTTVNVGGNSTGLVTDLGYEPQWLLYKRSSGGAADWSIVDVNRGFCQLENLVLAPNTTAAESNAAGGNSQFPSPTGFQLNVGSVGNTFIYIAIRRAPMKVPTVGTSVFAPLVTAASDATIGTTNFPIDLQIGGYRASTNSTNNWNMFTRRIKVSTTSDNSGAGLRTSGTDAENTGLTYPIRYNNTGYQNYGSRTWSLNFSRAPQFFEVVCYTGTGVTRTVSHNLGVAPELIIIKSRSNSGVNYAWPVYAAPRGATQGAYLNSSDEFAVGYGTPFWNDTAPTASVFTLGTTQQLNGSGSTYVAYLFATCAGVSKVGSYTGTGTTKQIDCGFTAGARFVLIKRTDSTGAWYVWDTARGIIAGNDPYLLLNSTAAEVTNTDYIDTYSAGFEISSTAPSAINANGGSFIFLAIA